MAVLVISPLAPILLQAFASAPLYDARWVFTLQNTRDFLASYEVWAAAGNTLIFAVASTLIALVVGLLFAILIGRTDMPFRGVIGDVFMVPLYLSHLILGLGWLTMYAPSGFISSWLESIGVPQPNLYTLAGMSLVAGISQAPLVYMYCLYGAAGGGYTTLEDAGRSAGAGKARVLFSITVPMLIPALTYSAILNIVAGLEMLAIPKLFGNTSNIQTLSTYLFTKGIDSTTPNHGLVANVAFLLMALVGISLAIQWKLLKDAFKYTTVKGKASQGRRVPLGFWRWPLMLLCLAYMMVTTIIPVGGIVVRAFTVVLTPLVPITRVLTLENMVRSFQEPRFFNAIVNTIEVGILAAVLGTLFCTALVFISQRSNYRFRWVTELLAGLPRALPGLVIGLGVFYAAVLFPPFEILRNTIWILVVAYLMSILPMGIGIIAPAVLQIDRELDKAARTSGADWLKTCTHIILPLLKPALAGSVILLFVASLKAYTIAMFLFSPNTEVLGSAILLLASDGDMGLSCALATIQICFTFAVVFLARGLMGVRVYA